MKTSSCSSRFSNRRIRYLFAGAVLVLKPFGPVPDLIKEKNPWRGFHDQGPLLTVFRVQKVPIAGAPECASWIGALSSDSIGKHLKATAQEDWEKATSVWSPWKPEELKGIESCDKNPCEIKLNDAEAAQMGATPATGRRAKYMQIVQARVQRYERTQERKEYEFKGDPVDSWKYFDTLGLKTDLAIPAPIKLELRRTDFFPGRVKTLHQVFDTRIALAPDKKEGALWRRDVYTDHYFDSWGEWLNMRCDGTSVTVVQAVMLELDLMKKTDVFSKLMRSKMRGAAEDNGTIYLNQWFERLRKEAAEKTKSASSK